jgi:thymidine kinase
MSSPNSIQKAVEYGLKTGLLNSNSLAPNPKLTPKKVSGYLQLWIGPMFAGKSSRLMSKLTTYADLGYRVLYINHSDDTRESCGDATFSTHSSQYKGLSDKITAIKRTRLADIDVSDFDVIGVDETGFFFDLVPVIDHWVNQEHKIVLGAGLDGNSLKKPFGSTLELICLADKVTKLNAACHLCLLSSMQGEPGQIPHVPNIVKAPFTACLTSSSGERKVGGLESYSSMCRYHHNQHLANQNQ